MSCSRFSDGPRALSYPLVSFNGVQRFARPTFQRFNGLDRRVASHHTCEKTTGYDVSEAMVTVALLDSNACARAER